MIEIIPYTPYIIDEYWSVWFTKLWWLETPDLPEEDEYAMKLTFCLN